MCFWQAHSTIVYLATNFDNILIMPKNETINIDGTRWSQRFVFAQWILGGAGGCPARYGCQVMWPTYRWSYFVEFVKMYKLTVGILCQKLCKWIDFCID